VKEKLQQLTLARWIIIVSFVGSVALGYYGYRLHRTRVELEVALKTSVPKLAVELQTLAKQYSLLKSQAEHEAFSGNVTNVGTYVRNIAAGTDVRIGDIAIDNPTENKITEGVLDTRYAVKPSSRDRGYPRLNIANFLYKLESDSRGMRVTRLRMEPEAKNVKPETILENDSWKWEAELTTRTKIEKR
jgi:hypothetical protein